MPLTGGTTVLNIVATSPTGAHRARARTVVVWDFVPGTCCSTSTDPVSDDNGPGNYAYPTVGDFQAGRVRPAALPGLRRRRRRSSSACSTRDLTPTFGSPLGAQLVDVYVHDPGRDARRRRPRRSRSATTRSRRRGAWSRLIEVQGFGQRYVDASGATLGTIDIRANEISRYITFSVPEGQPRQRPARAGASRSC